jgi:sugar phosphate isomerase/epimerase
MIPLAVQTYTIRNEWKEDPRKALAELVALGVTQVELARVAFTPQTAKIVNDSGLQVIAVQAKFKELDGDFDAMVAFLKAVRCNIAVVSVLGLKPMFLGKRAVQAYAKELDSLALRYRNEGITIAFHHHNFEFVKVSGMTKLEWLLESSREIRFISDTYWCQVAGHEPLDVARKIGDRLIGWHLRDYDTVSKNHPDLPCGKGSIDFAKLLANAPSDLAYGAIEQNSTQPILDLKTSLNHLRSIQAKEAL